MTKPWSCFSRALANNHTQALAVKKSISNSHVRQKRLMAKRLKKDMDVMDGRVAVY